MALVAYDYSSGSDADIADDEISTSSKDIIKAQDVPVAPQEARYLTDDNNPDSKAEYGIFSQLPKVKPNVPQMSAESDQLEDFIPTVKTLKERKKVQITIPSLSDFDDPSSEEPAPKRVKPSQKGSGLLGMLPPVQSAPKDNTMFVPNSLKKKSAPLKPASVSKGVVPKSTKKAIAPVVRRKAESDSDTDNEDITVPDTFDEQMWEKVCGRSKTRKPIVEVDLRVQEDPEQITSAPIPEQPYEGLDNVAFKELVGKTKRPVGNIKLIDINEDQILPDKDLWMTKSLTDPELAPRPEPQDPVDPTKKRKHHITYLAQQAKANEQELKSAWATSKNNRMMSRSKYGF